MDALRMSFKNRVIRNCLTVLLMNMFLVSSGLAQSGTVSGELKRWHKVTIDFAGPQTGEADNTNPFTDYRLDVTFTHLGTSQTFTVPGFFACDGDAANSGATTGNIWRVHFAPNEVGQWNYEVSFRTGNNVAMSEQANAGVSAGFFDGASDNFSVTETDKTGSDLRFKGRLQYVGEHYPKFAGTGEYFLKQGADSPENLLAYDEFDGPFINDGQNDQFIKNWAPHVADWNDGDPVWAGDRGKGLIGAINYLASEQMNAISFLPMNIGGDDRNVFPYLNYNERLRMDVSRLAQWEMVFEHADHKGMFLHFKTQETENDQLLDGGELGDERRLYYRELIARFSHHLALNWNLGEENTNTTEQRIEFAQFFHDNDPYQHLIVVHTFPNQQNSVYTPLLGDESELTGVSIQTSQSNFSQVHDRALQWVQNSAAAGQPWAVAVDEPGDAQHAIRPDNDAGNSHVDGRKNALWGTLMAGGWGNEYYFGYGHAHSDLTLQDFRSRDQWWDYARHALRFFHDNDVPYWQMANDNSLSSAGQDYAFFKTNECYVVYLKNGGTTNLDLSAATGTFEVRWYDPRNGGGLQLGSVSSVNGNGVRSLGSPPNSTHLDWTILVRRDTGINSPPTVNVTDVVPIPGTGGLSFQLIAAVNDDGLILSTPELMWSGTGPGAVTFEDPIEFSTNVSFAFPGKYSVTLTADDGEFESSDTQSIVAGESVSLMFEPVDDATVEGNNGINDTFIKLQEAGPSRVGYLKFELSGLGQASVSAARVEMTVTQDPGNGTLQLFSGANNEWTEETINAGNAPGTDVLIDSLTGSFGLGQIVSFDVSNSIVGDGVYTYVLTHNGGSDVWFSSKEGASPPRLMVEYVDILMGDVNCDGLVNLLDVQPFVDLIAGGDYNPKADFDGNGFVNLLDVGPFIGVLSQ